METALGGFCVELTRHFGGGRGVVNEDRAGFHPCEGAVVADGDRAEVVVISDAGHDEVLSFGSGLRRCCSAAAELFGPGFRLCAGAVVHRHLMAALGDEMASHAGSP